MAAGECESTYKVLVLGDSNVGKTCIVHRYCDQAYYDTYISTIGIDFKQKIISLDGTPIKMQICQRKRVGFKTVTSSSLAWYSIQLPVPAAAIVNNGGFREYVHFHRDTAGQERFRTLTTAYYRGAMGILLMYDVTNIESFHNLTYWLKNIEENASPDVIKVLAGNKCDATSQRAVALDMGQKLAENYDIPFYEVSCKQNINVDTIFLTLARLIRKQRSFHQLTEREHYDSGQNGNITLDLRSRILEHTSLKEPLKCNC